MFIVFAIGIYFIHKKNMFLNNKLYNLNIRLKQDLFELKFSLAVAHGIHVAVGRALVINKKNLILIEEKKDKKEIQERKSKMEI